ncbi:MAG TPA: hypothetical protein VNI01_00345, partial [Elusimicrobiota bacterium]|nr:hypothetical protein [Elusimicrobiota bacterium]
YLIIWSPARELHDAEHSPILAAMDPPVGDEEPAAWNNHSIQGVPPRGDANALQVPIKIRPALAIKLVPPGTRRVMISEVSSAVTDSDITLRFSVEGKDIESAWVESSQDELEWTRVTDILREPPYVFTIPRAALPQRGGYLRAKARDWTAVEGASRDLLVTAHGAR